jgi:hypothetical protein
MSKSVVEDLEITVKLLMKNEGVGEQPTSLPFSIRFFPRSKTMICL